MTPEVGRSKHDGDKGERRQFEGRQCQALNGPSNRICSEPKYLDYSKKAFSWLGYSSCIMMCRPRDKELTERNHHIYFYHQCLLE